MKKEFIQVNEVSLGTIFDDKVDERPLLIYVHGGPLYPESAIITKYFPQISQFFQCVFPEMRGAGMNATIDITDGKAVFDDFASDVKEITRHFLERFNKKKAFILGHSFGTVTASKVVKAYPELYHAYIGVGQVNDMYEHNKIVYDFMLTTAKNKNKKKLMAKLENNKNRAYLSSKEFFLSSQQITAAERKTIFHTRKYGSFQTIKDVFSYKLYSFTEKKQFFGALFSSKLMTFLTNDMFDMNIGEEIESLVIPMYLFAGKHDLMACTEQALAFYDKIDAPKKSFYTYENSAHFPMFDEPQKFEKDLQEIIAAF
ncbi:alpha/beta fold hydrolase [Isobaculum melis]|uniref:Pimeloyl-ACP methyl ester carboxylesterase n=1 Tax=Isobaculum melis TaxID=142588 RepID=A0A1H9TF54_9LACT|nr:alpha/beta hydrolase [Isobaculum melis]SER95771.1 Pimeloyl-ACP methyl ester carboxylesterase [Isobaculum melis]